MFDFPLLYGNRATCLKEKGNIVITLRLARKYFGIDNAVGRQIITADSQHFRVTGVIADFDNTVINKDIEALIDFHMQNMTMLPVLTRIFHKAISAVRLRLCR